MNYPAQIIAESQSAPLMVSEEIYWRDYYEESDPIYEWNNGVLEEKPVSDYETISIYFWFIYLLRLFLETRPLAAMVGLEMGCKLNLPNKSVIRKPDLGIVLNSNPVPLQTQDMRYQGIFDICIEALSESTKRERERDLIVKKSEYALAGIKEYFILHQAEQRFYRLNADIYMPIEPDRQGIIRSEVLPGFQFRLEDLRQRPGAEKMMRDSVYREFVFPGWQAAEKRAQAELKLRREAELNTQVEAKLRSVAEQRAAAAQAEIDRLMKLLKK